MNRAAGTRRRWAAGWAIVGTLALATAPAPVQHAHANPASDGDTNRYARPVVVAAPGAVRVPLTPDIMARMRAGWPDLRVMSAEGDLVPFRLTDNVAAPTVPPTPHITDVTEVGDHWQITVDAGADAGAHRALLLPFEDPGVAFDVAVEASDDGVSWRPAAEATLFNLGPSAAVRRFRIAYAPTTARYLRFQWPASDEPPEFTGLEVEPVPGYVEDPWQLPLTAATLPAGESDAAGATMTFAAPGPGVPLDGLDVAWRGPRSVAYRVEQAQGGSWQPAVEGILTAEGPASTETWHARITPNGGAWEGPLRLSLYGGAGVPVEVVEASGAVAPRWVVFEAQDAGAYALRYGSPVALAADQPPSTSLDASTATEIPAGAETEVVLKPDPLGLAPFAPAAVLNPRDFGVALPLTTTVAGPAPALHRLALPASLYASARRDLGDLRLATGTSQVPYLMEAAPDPEVVTATLGAEPQPAGRGRSSVALDVPLDGLPLTALVLEAPSSAFTRGVTVSGHGRASAPPLDLGSAVWHCPGATELPCRVEIPIYGAPAGPLTITFDDGDNQPLPSVDARLFMRRHEAVFVWPGGDETTPRQEVVLLAGNAQVPPPQYDLVGVADIMEAPAARASVAPTEDPTGEGLLGGERMVQLAVVAAAVVLFALLALMVRNARPQAEETA